jgi:hypothetical protein
VLGQHDTQDQRAQVRFQADLVEGLGAQHQRREQPEQGVQFAVDRSGS